MQLTLEGMASNKKYKLISKKTDDSLMNTLIHSGFPMASSCNGKGVCKKCIIYNETDTCVLSCQLTYNEYFDNFGNLVKVSYL